MISYPRIPESGEIPTIAFTDLNDFAVKVLSSLLIKQSYYILGLGHMVDMSSANMQLHPGGYVEYSRNVDWRTLMFHRIESRPDNVLATILNSRAQQVMSMDLVPTFSLNAAKIDMWDVSQWTATIYNPNDLTLPTQIIDYSHNGDLNILSGLPYVSYGLPLVQSQYRFDDAEHTYHRIQKPFHCSFGNSLVENELPYTPNSFSPESLMVHIIDPFSERPFIE